MKLTGKEKFIYNNKELDFDITEFWKYKFSEIYDLQSEIAEFIVEKALGLTESQNTEYWTLYDLKYKGKRIEVKETSYYHSFNKKGEERSKQRNFSITKAYSEYQNNKSSFERQNDIYVFCLNTGKERNDSYPLDLNNWEFYVIPTKIINEKCGNNKSISLGRVKEISCGCIKYFDLKKTIDNIIENDK